MSFLKFILKNPFRRKNSAILAIVGIAIGIIVIVALGAITDGLVNTFEDTIHAGGADFSISGKETGDSAYGTNTIDASWTDKISKVQGVDEAYLPMTTTIRLAMISKSTERNLRLSESIKPEMRIWPEESSHQSPRSGS